MIISIAGNILSGKSTLAQKICSIYDYSYVPSKRNELSFLDDFFDDIPSYFFATQTSFLVSKVLEIEEEVKKNNNIVIDRSLYEDVNVFAQLWMDNYDIDKREKILYKNLAEYILRSIPATDIFIYCKCSFETLSNRFLSRKHRSFEEKYPQDYLMQLCDKYNNIVFPKDSVVVEVDSEKINFNCDEEVIEFMSYVEGCINENGNSQQLSIWDYENNYEKKEYIQNAYAKVFVPYKENLSLMEHFKIKRKKIYIAAPFTEFAVEKPKKNTEMSFSIDDDRPYYILPIKYQRFLNRLKSSILSLGNIDVILPHKDENNWGKTYISSKQVINGMIDNINASDIIVAIVSQSVGVYMEIAMMAVLNKPMVIFIVDELSNGFYANGLRDRSNTLVINVQNLGDVEKAFKSDAVINFIKGR